MGNKYFLKNSTILRLVNTKEVNANKLTQVLQYSNTLLKNAMIISYANHLQKRLYGEDLTINSYLFKINNRYTRKICEMCTKLIIRH